MYIQETCDFCKNPGDLVVCGCCEGLGCENCVIYYYEENNWYCKDCYNES